MSKSAFLNGYFKEEVYVMQPPGFENNKFPNHVFKLSKALYGLKQAYRGMIGSLLYLTVSRPDIVFSVELCARFQSKPNETHLKAVKRIIRYLKHTPDITLWYPKGCNFDLVGYANADYAGFLVDRKSTSSMAHFLGPCLVSWTNKKQHSVVMSTAEAEYVAAASCCAELI